MAPVYGDKALALTITCLCICCILTERVVYLQTYDRDALLRRREHSDSKSIPTFLLFVLKYHCMKTMRDTRHALLISAALDARTTTTTIHAPPLMAGASEANVPAC